MKTFKHKKTGELITYKDGCIYANRTVIEAEPNLEFWEEVVEKEWEILSFKNTYAGFPCELKPDGFYHYPIAESKLKWTEKQFLGYPETLIHSIKRLSDNEIFTIGDMCAVDVRAFPITEFNIFDGVLLVSGYFEGSKSGFYNCKIKDLKKRKPLFKTFDGVDVFEGDYYHSVNPLYIYCGKNTITISNRPDKSNHWETNRNCLKFFSSKEKAEEFIFWNTPCLSLKEVTEHWQQEKDLKELVKSRL